MGQFSVEKPVLPGSVLSGNQHTGHRAAMTARVAHGRKVAVVGDGAVGLCGLIAARRLGAEQIIIMGRHQDRILLAKELGATDVVSDRGDGAINRIRELTGGFGVHSFHQNVIIAGGPAPVRACMAELLPEVMNGRIEPGRVFDRTVDLDGVPDGYRDMNEREAEGHDLAVEQMFLELKRRTVRAYAKFDSERRVTFANCCASSPPMPPAG